MAYLIGTIVGGLFEKNLGDTEVLTMFLVIMCLGYAALPQSQVTPATERLTAVTG